MDEFPEDVLFNILARLPIKVVSSFRRVSKSWRKLISEPYFKTNYVSNSPFTIIYRVQRRSLLLLEFARNGDCTVAPIKPITEYNHVTVIGSRDCSVFFFAARYSGVEYVTQSVFLFNPVLGSCLKVIDDGFELWWYFRAYKVGFIPSNSTYKLVKLYYPYSAFNEKHEKTKIFTVGLDKNWRNVDDPLLFDDACDFEQVISFNGAFHWVSNNYDDMICTFDLLEEKCGVGIPKPHGVTRLWRTTGLTTKWIAGLTIVKDRLCVADQPDNSTMVIWSMKEYGDVESWSSIFVLSLCYVPHEISRSFFPLPVAVFPNANVLFIGMLGIYFYNFKEERLTKIEEEQLTEIEHPNTTLFTRFVNKYAPTLPALKNLMWRTIICRVDRQ